MRAKLSPLLLAFVGLALATVAHAVSLPGPYPAGLTEISRRVAERAFAEVYENKEIPYSFPDGCYAKAQKIALLLEARGIISGKAFVEGGIFHRDPEWGELFWLFHVANFVLVSEAGTAHPYVIDPYLAGHLVSYERWLELVAGDHRTNVKDKYFTNRFVYDPEHASRAPQDYDPALLRDMEIVFKQAWQRINTRLRQKRNDPPPAP